ncbi:la-related 4 isoform X6, partial [Brachionus plicatilis]
MMMTMMINNEQQLEQSDEAVRAELLRTLEYYFSSKNLSKDEYLVSQMDDECYVSLDEIAKFNKIRTLTNDKRFIRHIIGQSDQLELDAATGNKVRSVNGRLGGACGSKAAPSTGHQRSVLILREVSPQATAEHI